MELTLDQMLQHKKIILTTMKLRDVTSQVQEAMVRYALTRYEGNVSKTARELGISRPTLYTLMQKHSITYNGPTA